MAGSRGLSWSVNEETGDLEVEIERMEGRTCEEISELIARVSGDGHAEVTNKPEYYRHVVTPRTEVRRGGGR
ncbi:MAG: hypothetical protein M3P51_14850 [Chloroflexota bacterium]|nr:hypothetical protein [Chloroflexota bacterium]